MTYYQLDQIADSYIPLLGVVTFCFFVKQLLSGGRESVLLDFSTTVLGAVYIYCLMYLDTWLGAFEAIGLDYSTHTALALVLVTTLSCIGEKMRILSLWSMALYCLLMLYQEYHSVLDILLTALVAWPVLVWLKLHAQRRKALNITI